MNVDYNSIMKPNIAKKTITGCIKDYLEYLKTVEHLSKSTLTKYKSILSSILEPISVPYMNITSDIVNDSFYKKHSKNPYTKRYASIVTTVLQSMFNWAKEYSYTLNNVKVINPVTGLSAKFPKTYTKKPIQKDLEFTPKVEKSFSPVHIVDSSTHTPSNTGIMVNSSPISITTEPPVDLPEELYKRNTAILQLFTHHNITISEIVELNIYDFVHNHLIIQSCHDRSRMRTIPLKSHVRNHIYQYLCTRNDTLDSLFLSETPGKGVTEEELQTLLAASISSISIK